MSLSLRPALWVGLLLAPLAQAGEGSTTPYAVLYQVLEPAQQIAAYDHLRAVQRIDSRLPDVSPAQIRLVVKARRGDIAVPIGADGRLDFPLDAALKAENPAVQSNQPKGSLSLTVTLELRLPAGDRVPWQELATALEQARRVLGEQAQAHGLAAPAVTGAEFHFPAGSEARVTLSGKGERLLLADGAGRVIVMLDETTRKEQPTLLLGARPLAVVPHLEASAAP
ncbi:MAG TPA: hypothetical protein PLN91_10855 [Rhodanobacteraceae bacterium]|nr:hypothetical protein [Rhodanobacteraceae bacterium]